MRVSANKHDPGYRHYCEARADGAKIVVYLDGRRQNTHLMETVDDGAGEIVRFVTDDLVCVRVDPERPDRLLTETIRGRVRIVRCYPAPESATWLRQDSHR